MKRAALALIRITDKTISTVILIVFLIVFAALLYFFSENETLIQEADSNQYQIFKPDGNDELSLDELRRINPEVIGWLTIDDTPVDYPVVQSDNNSKYVNTSVLGEFSLTGALFLDCRNDPGFSDTLSVIYGHNMTGSVMFGDFYLYEDEAYYEAHRNGLLFFGAGYHELRIIAFFEADGYDRSVYAVRLQEPERTEWLERIRETAIHFSEPVYGDRPLLMLSTCMSGNTNGRTILLAEIGGLTEAPVTEEPPKSTEVSPVSILDRNVDAPNWTWLLFLLLLIGMSVVYILWTYRRKKGARDGREKRSSDNG